MYNRNGSVIFNCFQYDLDNNHTWKDLSKMIFIFRCVFIYKLYKVNHHLLQDNLNTNTNINYNLRKIQKFKTQRFNKCIGTKSFNYWATSILNNIPPNILEKNYSIASFKNQIELELDSNNAFLNYFEKNFKF